MRLFYFNFFVYIAYECTRVYTLRIGTISVFGLRNTNDTRGMGLLNIIRIENVRITRFSVFPFVFMVDENPARP